MLIARVVLRSPPTIRKARCTTTSAPVNASRKVCASRTSPRRYSIFVQPWLPGAKGRRATPTILSTRSSAWSSGTRPWPNVPVGPVTATVRPFDRETAAVPLRGRRVVGGGPLPVCFVELRRLPRVAAAFLVVAFLVVAWLAPSCLASLRAVGGVDREAPEDRFLVVPDRPSVAAGRSASFLPADRRLSAGPEVGWSDDPAAGDPAAGDSAAGGSG